MAIVINPYTIPSFFAGIISLILGIYALYKNPKERTTQVFFILMLGCSLWSLTPIIIQAQTAAENALFWAKLSNTGLLIIPTALLHFSFIFQRKKAIELYKIAIVYIIAIVMIIILLGTNLLFTMADDVLIDGDGSQTRGRGEGNYTEERYDQLDRESLETFNYMDIDEDEYYTITDDSVEPLRYNGEIIVGYEDNESTWQTLNNSENYKFIYFVDEDKDDKYTLGEALYLENGDGNQNLVFNYIPGFLYYLLILFFFGLIIASIVNLFLFYRANEDISIKKSVSYLIFGLIAIIIFILSQSALAFLMPVIILDSAIALIIALFFTVAVLKYNIIDIKLIIRKSMFYSAVSLIVVCSFVLVEEGMELLFAELAFSGSILAGVIAAFVALGVISAFKKGLRHQIDKLFPNVRYLDKEYQNRITAYKATLFAMMVDGILSPKELSAIHILRDKLEIKPKEHEQLMQDIQLEIHRHPSTNLALR